MLKTPKDNQVIKYIAKEYTKTINKNNNKQQIK